VHNTITARSGPTRAEWAGIAQCLALSAQHVLLPSRSLALRTITPITSESEPGIFPTLLRKANKWWRKIGEFLRAGGHDETSRDLIVRLLRKRLSAQFALPVDQRRSLHQFNYHWWRPITAPGRIKTGLVIPWHRPEGFDYQEQSEAFNQSHDEGAVRESVWQRRRAVAQRLSLAFARAPRFRMRPRSALPTLRTATRSCWQPPSPKPARNLKQIPPPRISRRRTNPRQRETIGR